MSEHPEGRIWSTVELARAAGLTDGRLRQMLIAGELEGFKLADRIWAIPDEAARRFLAERRKRFVAWERTEE